MQFYTDVRGAAWILGLRESTIYERIKRGRINYRTFGKRYLIPITDLLLESGKNQREVLTILQKENFALWECS